MAAQNIVNQWVLRRTMKAGPDPMKYWRPYLIIAGALLVLVGVEVAFHPGFVVAVVVSALASLVVLRLTRRSLDLLTMFPELRKVPFARLLTA